MATKTKPKAQTETSATKATKFIARKSKTQKLITSAGKVIAEAYAKVSARVGEFHRGFKNGSIKTTYLIEEGRVIFEALVTLDISNPNRCFNGHAMAKLTGEQKQFEKLETVAVGRALAFAGFLSEGDIASLDEIESALVEEEEESLYEKALKMIESADKAASLNNLLDRVVSNKTDFTPEQKETLIGYIDERRKRVTDVPKIPQSGTGGGLGDQGDVMIVSVNA